MEWSPQQEEALEKVSHWFHHSDEQVFRLFGYAGTGKTTLAKHLARQIGGKVLFAAFSGKAASVMRSKGCENASTVHSLIYTPIQGSNPLEFVLNASSELDSARLLILDECSMVNDTMASDLLSFGTKVLVLGDPAQLPPVKGTGYFIQESPDVLLTEIHRQAKDDPIVKLATMCRNGEPLEVGSYGDTRVIHRSNVDADEILAADQVLVGRNKTRESFNRRIRELKGFESKLPAEGDRLVCLRNNHHLGLLNGEIWYTKSSAGTLEGAEYFFLHIEDESHERHRVVRTHTSYFDPKVEKPKYVYRLAEEFSYGYALTVHKSQGSQWDHVVVYNESEVFRESSRNWLYTAVTRAAKKLTVIL